MAQARKIRSLHRRGWTQMELSWAYEISQNDYFQNRQQPDLPGCGMMTKDTVEAGLFTLLVASVLLRCLWGIHRSTSGDDPHFC